MLGELFGWYIASAGDFWSTVLRIGLPQILLLVLIICWLRRKKCGESDGGCCCCWIWSCRSACSRRKADHGGHGSSHCCMEDDAGQADAGADAGDVAADDA